MTHSLPLAVAFAGFCSEHPPLRQRLQAQQAHYFALAEWIHERSRDQHLTVIGINGTQASGKSTLSALLQQLLEKGFGRRTAILSLDDFYLTRAQRAQLAQEAHPLLATRGVPGTHDVPMMLEVLDRLASAGAGEPIRIPRFIKTHDDRAPKADWNTLTAPVEIVLLEGWCVGLPPQAASELCEPVNSLEAEEDPDGVWRGFVNAQLAGRYAKLFSRIDRLVMLQAPGFEVVHGWRLQQEAGNAAAGGDHILDSSSLRRFIAHYERLTRHALRTLPEKADVLWVLDAERRVVRVNYS